MAKAKTKLKDLNEGLKSRKKPKPKPSGPSVEQKALAVVQEIEVSNEKRNAATMEVLDKLVSKEFVVNADVSVDADAIGEAVGKQLKDMPAPVINFPERKPSSYEVSGFKRDSKGNMTKFRIDPVAE